jgi:DNA gyrase/topoisomerase IV subunit A
MIDNPLDGDSIRLKRLEAELLAATRAHEIIAIVEREQSSKAAIPQIMQAFSLSEEQAVIVLDTRFGVVTLAAQRQIEQRIAALNPPEEPAAVNHPGIDLT